jgi:putative hydrolase of the HAD superfamily
MIKAIIFDLDDTLYEEKQFVMSGFQTVAKHLSKINNVKYSKIFKILKQDFQKGLRKKNFDVLLQKLNMVGETPNNLVKIYREHYPTINLFYDAKKILTNLKGKFRFGLITDGYITPQNNKIHSLGIKDYFDAILINDLEKGISKADKKPFLDILFQLDVEAKNTLFTADNPIKDFLNAKNLGIHTTRIKRKKGEYAGITVNHSVEADYTISTLLDLPKIIKKYRDC